MGARAWIAYVVCAVAMGLVLLCFAFAGSRVTTTGGPYVYVKLAFGAFPAFLAGILLWVATVLSSAAVATVFAGTLGAMVPAVNTGTGRVVALLLLYSIAVAVNARGVGFGARTVTGLALAKVLPLLGLVLLAGVLWLTGHLPPAVVPAPPAAAAEQPLQAGAVGRTSLILIFAFFGAEVALAPSGEVRRPALTVPLAIGIALGIVTILYLALQAVAQGVLGNALAQDPAVRAAPLAAVGNRLIGSVGMDVLTAAALVSTAGYVIGDTLASPRLLYALADDGYLPGILSRLHVRHATPVIAIWVHGGTAAFLALSGTFATLVILNNVANLALYLACCLGALVLVRRDAVHARSLPSGAPAPAPFRLPLGPLVPLLACGIVIWLLAQAAWSEFKAVAVAVAVATVAYAFRRRTASSVSIK